MSGRMLAVVALTAWAGATLLLSCLRWFGRPHLSDRLRPYRPGAPAPGGARAALSVGTVRDVIGPVARDLGTSLSRALGVTEEMGVRLRRVHSPDDVTDVRLRQAGWAGAALGAAVLATQTLTLPVPAALLLLAGAPALAFLVVEHRVAVASQRWQERTFLELPVVAEQLGMLLSAGYSLGAAVHRLAERGQGVCGVELGVVGARTRQGLSEVDALREWADRADVAELHRLVDVLALNREAGDLGHLIAEEARSCRREVQRRTLEVIERRGQQVWIPVTVATLLPGVLFLVVPFIEAMRLFAGS